MAISSYPRTIQNGQLAANGNQNAGTGLMLYDSASGTYIAATPSTFAGGGGSATAANQTSQIALETSLNALVSTKANQISDALALANATNGGVLTDTLYNLTLSVGANNLVGVPCKYVTLINSTTNANIQYTTSVSPNFLNLEAGYSVKLNTSNGTNITVKQTTGENQLLEYIVTA